MNQEGLVSEPAEGGGGGGVGRDTEGRSVVEIDRKVSNICISI